MVVKVGQYFLSVSVRRFARLLASPRMGSFTSATKILNDDSQDQGLQIPDNIARNELVQYCQKMSVYPLLKRSFKKSDDSPSIRGFKMQTMKDCNDSVSSPYTLRIFQWNILSQALGQMNDHFTKCPDEALEWDYRKFKIIEEIIQYFPDIICLQEVDHFNFLKAVLGSQGYYGMFFPKPDSPCVYINGNNGPDGCAIFYKNDKFNLINVESRILEIWRVQSNQVALLANLQVKETGQEICVTTTHLKARQGALLSALRNEQGKDLLQFIKENCGGRPVIISGDFNAEPLEPIYSTILSDKFLNLGSAYADCDNNTHSNSASREPVYTTWKIRDEGEVCHTIDYIFYKKSDFNVETVLELPSGEEIGKDRVPSFSYPSDHFSLLCDFRIVDWQKLKKPSL